MTSRTARRNRLFALGALPAVVLLGIAVLLGLLVRGNADGRAAFADGEYGAAHETFAGLRDLGLVEPWVAPFDAGAAAYMDKDYDDAVARFEEALHDAPDVQECLVRVNLALAHEGRGAHVRKADATAALQAFRAGRDALGEGGCREYDGREVDRRLSKAIRAISRGGPADPDEQLTEQEKLEELERRNEETRERRPEEDVDPTEEPSVAIQW